MSWIDSAVDEECITEASFDALEKVLREYGYKVTRTRLQITGVYGGYWRTNGKISTIRIVDKGDYRECHDHETSKGYMMKPVQGRLAKLVEEAEKITEHRVNKVEKVKDKIKSKFSKGKKRFCEECGEPLSPTAKFCPNCGKKVK